MLEPITENIWAAAAPMKFMGVHLGTRMTVIRLSSGDLVLYSPVGLDGGLGEAVDALGRVRHIVAPNLYHHVFAGFAAQRYPDAVLHAPPKLAKKRPDLAIGHALPDADPSWAGEIVPIHVDGCILDETILHHPKSGTIACADLIENFHGSDHFPTRAYLKLAGIWQRPGVSRLIRPTFRDKRAARASLDRILALRIDRIVLTHGDPILENASAALRAGYAWLPS